MSLDGVGILVPAPSTVGVSIPNVDVAQRARAHGQHFDETWDAAVERALRLEANKFKRTCWLEALTVTRDAWRASYLGKPASRWALAAATLADDEHEQLAERRYPSDDCSQCSSPIPAQRGRFARYCSRKCARRAAHQARAA